MRRGVKDTLRVWTRSFPVLPGDGGVLQRVKAYRVPSPRPAAALWHSSVIGLALGIPRVRPIGPIERVMFPLATPANPRRAPIVSRERWPFDNTVSFFFFLFHPQSPVPKEGPVGHYRAISSEIPVWTSGGKLMCYCDERFLSQRVRVAAKSPKWRDKISW